MKLRNIRSPVLVGSFKTIARIRMLKSPPASISRQLPTTETIGLAVCRNSSQEIKEIENDLVSRIRVDANGNER